MNILINAFTCSPNAGSEPGMAWNWCNTLAKSCNLHIITEGYFKDEIEKALINHPYKENLHFYYSPLPDKVRKMWLNQGDWRFYKYYKEWQKTALSVAERIVEENNIDVLHQLNMIGFREPGYLWKIQGIPFIWGPVGGMELFPEAFLSSLPYKESMVIRLKNFLNVIQFKFSKRVNLALRRSSFTISATSMTQSAFAKYKNYQSELINETGSVPKDKLDKAMRQKGDTLNVLWVGKIVERKQLRLALKTIAAAKDLRIKLHIVGAGDYIKLKQDIEQLQIQEKCIIHEVIPHSEVQKLMQDSDLLFFTSVCEGTPHVVLEAISNSLPVLCFDCCGHGDCISKDIGDTVAVTTPEMAIREFANHLKSYEENPSLLQEYSDNCINVSRQLSWDERAKSMLKLYEKALGKK